jgi:hypothetical protein
MGQALKQGCSKNKCRKFIAMEIVAAHPAILFLYHLAIVLTVQ